MSAVSEIKEQSDRQPPLWDAIQERRRERLSSLIVAKCFERAAIFAKITGINPSLVSQYRTGARPITERTVAVIEAAFALPNWFEQTDEESEDAEIVADAFAAIAAMPDAPATFSPARLRPNDRFANVLTDLASLLPEDAAVLVAQIEAAAIKARRANASQGESQLKKASRAA
jgi:hypothetical protein